MVFCLSDSGDSGNFFLLTERNGRKPAAFLDNLQLWSPHRKLLSCGVLVMLRLLRLLSFVVVLFVSLVSFTGCGSGSVSAGGPFPTPTPSATPASADRKSVVEGKSVDLGGRRIN